MRTIEASFKKAAVFADIHFGKKSDSDVHNEDCLRYIKWFMQQVKDHDCDAIIFLGDWFDNQIRLGSNTLWAAMDAVTEILKVSKVPFYWLLGNHDLMYKHSRKIHSVRFVEKYVTLIDDLTLLTSDKGDVLLCPWLVNDEFVIPPNIEAKYVFGHFELPTFLLNNGREMDDKGGLHADHFMSPDYVFSGHFHRRQIKANANEVPICYIGNTFPHDYGDVGDRDRGCMILSWDEEPIFLNWTEGPNYNRTKLSSLLEAMENDTLGELYNEHSIIECTDDLGMSTQENLEVKELLQNMFRNLTIIQKETDVTVEQETEIEETEDISMMVVTYINELDVEGSQYQKEILLEMWEELDE